MKGFMSQNMDKDLISIIIPVYNAEKFLKETIETIKSQTYINWEAIFIDDNSTDNSKEIIKQNLQDNIKLIELSRNFGPAIARNEGLKIAKGRYIAYLDADDLWAENKLEVQHKVMKENDYAFSYTSYKHLNENGKVSKSIKVQEKLDYKEALKRIRVLTITSMFDLEKVDKKLLIMPDLEYTEDVATWWKILKEGYIAYGINEPLAFYRKTNNTRSSNKIKSMHRRWRLYRKQEKLSIIKSLYYFTYYIANAVLRRI